jgi:uncharacterized membrane protein
MEYAIIKLVHIISSTLLFGTGLGTAYYMVAANRTRKVNIIAQVSTDVVRADWFFTTPAVIIQPVTGFWLLSLIGRSWQESWVIVSLILYVIVGICWIPVVWIQIQLNRMARQAQASGAELSPRYYTLYHIWFALGWPAFIGVIAIFYLMVKKPVLW